ncbi:MAG: manganese-dependent inorganic pyrophosphatase [Clostridia bacterium]|nr:manganese-dependent inorganic pyrophosphatase [Clostridia bacterium]
MADKTFVFGHTNPDTDSIASAITMANLQTEMGNYSESFRLGDINKETKYALDTFRVEEPEMLANVDQTSNVIMIDNNEFSQSVSGIENAHIQMVVDHHRLNLHTAEPVYCIAEPVGCTATILYKLYKQDDVEITPKIAGMMLSAILSDTLMFKSPTCTQQDRITAERLAKIAGIDLYDYGYKLLEAGTDISGYTAEEVINIDSKDFQHQDLKITISQINSSNLEDVFKRKAELERAIEDKIARENIDLFVFVVTDILEANSQVIVLGNRTDIFERAFNVKLIGNTTILKGVVSRKKQILPAILEGLNKKIQL